MSGRILALCGGVGGVKLALGLSHILPPEKLGIMVNTGDDFEHLGLAISPDIDTVIYTLAGLSNPELGWGLAKESWAFMDQLRRLGGNDWFQLGDRDLALHVMRTQRLAAGENLASITADFARRLGLSVAVWPMTNDPVRTILETDEGQLSFQNYFVERKAQPAVRTISYAGAGEARPHDEALSWLADPDLEAVVICPSNPWLSIGPMLAMPALRDALSHISAPRLAVSPIVAGKAIKGPTAKLMSELHLPVTTVAVADFYEGLIDGYVIDEADRAFSATLGDRGLAVDVRSTVMTSLDGKMALARDVLAFVQHMRGEF